PRRDAHRQEQWDADRRKSVLPIRALTSSAGALSVTLLVACSADPDAHPSVDRARSRLYQGEPSGAAAEAPLALQSVHAAGTTAPWSGTLLGDNLFVTARHCIANVVSGPFDCDPMGELISLGDAGRMGTDLAPESITIVAVGSSGSNTSARGKTILSTNAPTI